ncbi:MAG TPA: ABC transporter permease [Candidatus Saccharimonadales bacterium]|nr:ABC transporter permease [Candidatus Saccharimonadales bacterium]
MNPWEILRSALGEVVHHKLRSTLTLLGIILGTASITFMTSLLDGVVAEVWEGISDIGFDGVMYVFNEQPKDLTEAALFARSRGLQPSDARMLASRGGIISKVAPVMYSDALVRRGDVERNVRVMGATPEYNDIRSRSMESGRWFNDSDEATFGRVCVLGYRLKRRLFGTEEALDKTVRIGSRGFRVIGVGEKLGSEFVNSGDFIREMEGLSVPLSTLRKFYTGEKSPLTFIAVKAGDIEDLSDLKAETTAALTIAHRGAKDFRIENVGEEMLRARKDVQTVLLNWRIVLGSIAGISLLVGGIGLLSVMLISIGERLYEIGLRKAIGATDLAVFVHFLAESVVLSLIGALIGAGVALLAMLWLKQFFPAGLPVNLTGLGGAIGIAILLGVVFGLYPAVRASRMEPVEALRSVA